MICKRFESEPFIPISYCNIITNKTTHNILIDILWGQGYAHIYVLPPSTVKSFRGRFKSSGVHDDAQDAELIAEVLMGAFMGVMILIILAQID